MAEKDINQQQEPEQQPKQQQPKQPFPNNPNRGNKPKGSKVLRYIYIAIFVAFGYFFFFGGSGVASKQPITWEKLEPILEKHDYESITVINEEQAEIRIKREAVRKDTVAYRNIIGRNGVDGPLGYYTYNIGNYEHFDKELSIIESRTGEHISYKIESPQRMARASRMVWPTAYVAVLLLDDEFHRTSADGWRWQWSWLRRHFRLWP